MTHTTNRLALPLLAAGQAQKEITHNEALAQIDMLVQPVIQSAVASTPPPSPNLGHCWIVAASATGAWFGKANHIACWTSGGWRFLAPFEGLTCWNLATLSDYRYDGSTWVSGELRGTALIIDSLQVVGPQTSAIATPIGGTTVDSQARITLTAILVALRSHGLIAN